MFNSTLRFSPPQVSLIRRLSHRSLSSLLLAVGLVAGGISPLLAQGSDHPGSAALQSHPNPSKRQDSAAMPDGVYLYGQAPERDQIGAAYLVFAVAGDRVTGAFYMPQSSFDCFQGEFSGDQLALNITNSYEQMTYPFSIAVTTTDPIVTADNPAIAPLTLEGYHEIADVSENDQRILETCQSQYQ